MSKKGENIYKRKDGRWEARYIKSYSPDGTAQYGYCYAQTYDDVKSKVNQARAMLLNAPLPTSHNTKTKLGEFCDEWLKMRRSKIKESTYVKYETILDNHIKRHLGDYRLQVLSSAVVEEFSHTLLHEEHLSTKTVRDILAVLHAVLDYTAKQNSLASSIDIVYPKTEKKEMRVLSREEQNRFVQYLMTDTDPCKFGTLLSLLTGLRIGEICALKWGHISLQQATIRVDSTMQRLKDTEHGGSKLFISDPKSFTSLRVIPLSALALDLCRKFSVDDPNAYVLTGAAEKIMEPRTLQYRMEQYTKDCHLSGIHFHTLRHSFATRCVEVGFEIKSLSEVLGHASPQITLERYVHSSIELKRENMSKLAAIGY